MWMLLSDERCSLFRESREYVATEIDETDLCTEFENPVNKEQRVSILTFVITGGRPEKVFDTVVDGFSQFGIARFVLPNTELLAEGLVRRKVVM